ncbi:MAG: RnfABCDGE type electron transport complex subunit D [Oscillospiraceae bacterium]|jgi:electron transport complex protein RnfD|nr:RnfABCDGE type electron transport complex subunit D [Oscillospiraceae bacterium]
MNKNLVITSSPHFRAATTTRDIMLDVLVALIPTLVLSVFIFGFRALILSAFCVIFCVLCEYVYRRLMKLSFTIGDLSAAVTGLILAFNLPVSLPLWMAAIGCFIAIVIVKQLFGGIGRNFANPAITARIALTISFVGPMTNWTAPRLFLSDAATSATPLALADAATSATAGVTALPGYMDMFLGMISGSIGETCKLTLLIGGLYLVLRKVITPTAPLAFVGTVFVLSWALGADPVYHILAGGLMLGAIFMATDYVTTPTTEMGKLIFGVGCGLITVIIRLYAGYPEGVSFAILLMNIVTPHIDRLCTIKAFGGARHKAL